MAYKALAPRRSAAHFALAQHHVLQRGQAFDADRPARMELVSADADLGAQAELETIGKARAGIDHHAGRIDLAEKTLGVQVVTRQDGVGMVA